MTTEHSAHQDIAFFGAICASISHELKNVIATISESAGLLDDLSALAEEGKSLPPETLGRMTERILRQVKRGNLIIKHMNQFAHSADHPRKEVDLAELLRLMVELCRRFADMRQVELEFEQGEPVVVETSPFGLEHVFYHAFKAALEAASGAPDPEAGQGRLKLEALADPPRIVISGLPAGQVLDLSTAESAGDVVGVAVRSGQGFVELEPAG